MQISTLKSGLLECLESISSERREAFGQDRCFAQCTWAWAIDVTHVPRSSNTMPSRRLSRAEYIGLGRVNGLTGISERIQAESLNGMERNE